MKTANELHDEWARSRGIDPPEESQQKRKAYLDALEAEKTASQDAQEAPQKKTKV